MVALRWNPSALRRRILPLVLAVGVLLGLAGMHNASSMPDPGDFTMTASMPQAVQSPPSTGMGASGTADRSAASIAPAPGEGMTHPMTDACCLTLVVALALAVLAAPGLLGRLDALRPRAGIPAADGPRPIRGIERQLALGILRI